MLALLACSSEPLPEDAEGLFHALWQAWDEDSQADHSRLGEVALALAELEPGRGELSTLSDEELAAFGPHDEQVGVSLILPLDCELEQVEDVVIHLEQDELFPDVFETYERVHTSDLQAWEQDRRPLGWQADYVVSIPLTSDLSCTLLGEIREPTEGVLVARSVLQPAAVSEDDDGVFDQDWRIEAWVQQDERVLHIEALWRHMDAGVVNTDNEAIRGLVLDGIEDWDEQVQHWCAVGVP
jgi:hypothetical protein